MKKITTLSFILLFALTVTSGGQLAVGYNTDGNTLCFSTILAPVFAIFFPIDIAIALTGVVIACLVDFTRLSVYASRFTASNINENLTLLISATLASIAGAYFGSKLLKKITLRFIQVLVAIILILISIALGSGII